jgi:hypothetical protein
MLRRFSIVYAEKTGSLLSIVGLTIMLPIATHAFQDILGLLFSRLSMMMPTTVSKVSDLSP